MSILLIAGLSALALGVGYVTYGRYLSRLLGIDADRPTPAMEMRDGIDYEPIPPKFLIGQHFSAIAAAGPIVGPILAGIMFGWLPALLWILLGSIFIGGVHDMTTLVASLRHKARSIAEIIREHMTRRSYLLFLSFVWIALVYVIVAFTDVTAQSFVGQQTLEDGSVVSGGGIATSSLLYLALPIVMGLLLHKAKLPLSIATAIFLPLVGVAIWVGQKIPLNMPGFLGLTPLQVWDILLLIYCYVASIVPLWILLQPRGHLGGYFLFAAIAAGAIGILFGGRTVEYPAFLGWTSGGDSPKSLFPFLFITVACGACSGFHAIVASGTTSKQVRREPDAQPVGYGSMLLEAMVAVMALSCVMMLSPTDTLIKGTPNLIYASGISRFLGVLHINPALGVCFGLMAFTTFVYDTLDVCTRLGRYILQEVTGWQGWKGRAMATLLTTGVPALFVTRTILGPDGKAMPAWKVFWNLFGSSNQLLAALSLLGVTVWLLRTSKIRGAWVVTAVPTAFMYLMSVWSLLLVVVPWLRSFGKGFRFDLVALVALILIALAFLLLIEALRIFWRRPSQPEEVLQPAAA
jgi:carbon starvation protein